MNLPTKQGHRLREAAYDCWGKDRGKGIVAEFGMDMSTLLRLKWITKVLLYSTWDSVHCYEASRIGGEFGGGWICGCV